MFEIHALRAFSDNYIWTLIKDDEVTVVDPGDGQVVTEFLIKQNLSLSNILITHHHFDHTGGIKKLAEIYNCKIFGPGEGHIEGITDPIKDHQEFTISGELFKAYATPGHTLDHLSYFVDHEKEPLLFCGDTLFSGGCGRLFEGSPEQMHNSLSKLAELPKQTKVFCTHEYTESNLNFAAEVEPNNQILKEKINAVKILRKQDKETLPSTIESELEINPFLRCSEPEVINAAEKYQNSELKTPSAVLASIRDWKDNF